MKPNILYLHCHDAGNGRQLWKTSFIPNGYRDLRGMHGELHANGDDTAPYSAEVASIQFGTTEVPAGGAGQYYDVTITFVTTGSAVAAAKRAVWLPPRE